MKIETKEIYKCDFCNKLYQRKWLCEKHEASCKKRPDYLRPCHDCKILKKVDEIVPSGYPGYSGCEGERTVSILFCSKKNCYIYPPSVAAKGNKFETGNKDNIEMPKECELYEKSNFTIFTELSK